MFRTWLCLAAAAVAAGCGGSLATPVDIDHRAQQLTWSGAWDAAQAEVARGLASARAAGDRAGEARLLLRRGEIRTDETRHRGGDRAPVLADLTAAHRLAEATGDPRLIADSVDALGLAAFYRWFETQDAGDLAAADARFRAALALRAPRGDSAELASSHFHIGLVHQMRGELGAAQGAFDRAYAIATRVDDPAQRSYAARHLAYLAELRHDLATAEQRYAESLALREQLGFGPGVPAAQVALAELRYQRDGDAPRALALLSTARAGAARAGSPAYVAVAELALARVHRDAGRDRDALAALASAIATMDRIHSDESVVEAYEQIALIDLLANDAPAAVTAADRALARRRTPRLEALRALAAARASRARAPKRAETSASPQTSAGPSATPAPGPIAAPAPGAIATHAPGASATPAPGSSSGPAPGASATPAPGASTTPAPGAIAAPAPGASTTPGSAPISDPAIPTTLAPADPVAVARTALAAGDAEAALTAAVAGDDPDTLLLAARAVGPAGAARARAAAEAMSRPQALRFARVLAAR
jgi:tetratricopeptide (TPR) repeat protein